MIGPEIFGEFVTLRPLRDDDLERRTEWLNDPETVKLFMGLVPERDYHRIDAERWRWKFESEITSVVWAIETRYHRHIGDVDLHEINRFDKSARLTVLIGDRAFWGKGFGTDAIHALLDYAFNDMGLESVALKVYDFNTRAIRCYEKCGFETVNSCGPGEILMTVAKENFMANKRNAHSISA